MLMLTIIKYLQDDLGLADYETKVRLMLSVLAFNNYPSRNKRIVNKKFDFDAVLWPTANQITRC